MNSWTRSVFQRRIVLALTAALLASSAGAVERQLKTGGSVPLPGAPGDPKNSAKTKPTKGTGESVGPASGNINDLGGVPHH